MFFDIAMLWEPLPGAKPRVVAPGSETLLFPSWSWAAWEGRVANNLSDFISANPPEIALYPVVRWHNVQSTRETKFVNRTLHFVHQMRKHIQDVDLSIFSTSAVDMNKITTGIRSQLSIRKAGIDSFTAEQ